MTAIFLPFRAVGARVDPASVAESLFVPGGKRMTMRKYLVLSVLGVCVLVLAPGTSAFAGGSTYYVGKNSQGQKLLFSVDHTASGPKFDPFFTTMVDRCPATGDVFTIQFSFFGFQIPIKNGKFNLTLNDISDRFGWSGTITPTKASGPQFYDLAAFDRGTGLQDCATGTISWAARALAAAAPKAAAPSASYRVAITKESNGSVHYTVTHG
jgi:hypothetical protein